MTVWRRGFPCELVMVLQDALHNSLRTVVARTRAVYGVVFLANSRAIGKKNAL